MERTSIDRLIINSPYEVPQRYWRYNRENRTFTLVDGERRPAGYVVASESSRSFDDPGVFVEIPLVNQIRPRVEVWRKAGYPGVTGITKRLLEHWTNPEEYETRRFFFCQLEAVSTLIWLTEAPAARRWVLTFLRTGARSLACAPRWRPEQARPSSWRWSLPGTS
jgi:type III restriction enzyme